ncbi:MAG: hypothetical protein MJH10_12070 [Epibacterium sp.]|nr:hypothetical protein [Epibacterium sp.]NQX74283.1 hypothetical protein [Epibacterium sp.]
MNLTIRPLFRESAQKRNTYLLRNGRRYGTTKAPGGSFVYNIQDSPSKKRLAIPLDRVVTNPYKDGGKMITNKWMNKGVEKLEKITRQTELEIKYNLEQGFLDPRSYRIDSKAPRTYLQKLTYRFNDGNNEIDTNTLDGELLLEAIEESTLIAKNYEDAVTKQARYYIEQKAEEEKVILSKRKKIRKALVAMDKLIDELPNDKLVEVTTILKITKGRTKNATAEMKLNNYIENKEKVQGLSQMDRLDQFVELVDLAASSKAADKKQFQAKLLLQRLLNSRIVTDLKGVYIWKSKQETEPGLAELARSKNEALLWLQDAGNKNYVTELKTELQLVLIN